MAFITVEGPARTMPATAHHTADVGDLPVAARSRRRIATGHLILALVALVSVFPVYWMFSHRVPAAGGLVVVQPDAVAAEPGELQVLWDIPMASMLVNTFLMAAAIAVSQLLVAIFAAYAFARWTFVGKQLLFMLFVGYVAVPFQVTMIPNYLLVSQTACWTPSPVWWCPTCAPPSVCCCCASTWRRSPGNCSTRR